jgi:hypothetical protein
MNWKLVIFDVYGVPKAVYTNKSPGGIVDYIEFNVEPSGNCLNAAFDGIPAKLNISPRDFVQIFVDDMDTPKYYGYLTNHFNNTSKRVVRYTAEGAKKLLHEHLVFDFWFKGTPDVEDSNENLTLVSHRQIVEGIKARLPEYVNTSIINQASEVTGNKPPVVESNVTFGEVMDGIVDSASDGKYVWGVNANRTFFVKPIDTDVIDFDDIDEKRVVFPSQNTDKIVTQVKFLFVLPKSFSGDGLNKASQSASYTDFNVDRNAYNYVTKDSRDDAPITYTYTDNTKASQFGTFIQTVPLVLSDSWLQELSFTEFLSRDASVTLSVTGSGDLFETNSGSTSPTNLRAAIEDPNDSSYVRNKVAEGGARLNLQFQKTTGNRKLPLDDFVGFALYYTADIGQDFYIYQSNEYLYRSWALSTKEYGSPYRDAMSFSTKEGTDAPTEGISRLAFNPRALTDFEIDPNGLDSNGYPFKTISRMTYRIAVYPIFWNTDTVYTLDSDKFRIKGVKLLCLNTEALDNYAKSFVITPVSFPAEITLPKFVGLKGNATYQEDTLPIQRVRTVLSRQDGHAVTYVIGSDQERQNQALNRIFQRDTQMLNRAVRISSGT